MKKSVIYNLRRKCQIVAYRLTSAELMSKIYYRIVLHKKLNLKNPKTFNEKLQWLKLYYFPNNQKAIDCACKYKVREYVKEKGLEDTLNDLYGVYDCVDEIDFDALPNQFVLKCSHGCGYNILCPDKCKLDIENTKRMLNKWMKEDFSEFNAEPHYSKIKPKIICEKYLGGDMVDYKFFCFNGEPEFMYIAKGFGEGEDETISFFDKEGNKAEYKRADFRAYENAKIPESFNSMMEMSRVLSKDFPFVRVDLFEVDGKIYFSELTFTPCGCMMKVDPQEIEEKWGELIDLSNLEL